MENWETGREDNLPGTDGLQVETGSIVDAELVDRVFGAFGPDVVVHAAASYKDPNAWRADIETNVGGTAAVVQSAVDHGVGRLLYLQTALCYGTHPEEQPITLGHPLRPDSSYAISKTAGEQYIAMSDLDYVSLRLANVYGPRNVSGPLPTFFSRLRGGKEVFVMDTRRDFIYVDDLVEVATRVIGGEGRGAYHVSSGADVSIKELFDATVEALGIDAPEVEVRPRGEDDAASILLDPSRTREEFGWEPSTPLRDGVRAAIEWYDSHGVGETYTHLKLPGK